MRILNEIAKPMQNERACRGGRGCSKLGAQSYFWVSLIFSIKNQLDNGNFKIKTQWGSLDDPKFRSRWVGEIWQSHGTFSIGLAWFRFTGDNKRNLFCCYIKGLSLIPTPWKAFLVHMYTALPLCIGTTNWGHLEDKMQFDKKIIFFQNFEKAYISQ